MGILVLQRLEELGNLVNFVLKLHLGLDNNSSLQWLRFDVNFLLRIITNKNN